MNLNLNKLYYFYVVARKGSIKAASQLLNLTQPTISGQIKDLEEDLGCQLFIRKHRKLIISPQGEAVLEKAAKIFELANELSDSSKTQFKKKRLKIKIGAIQSLSNSFITSFSTKIWKDESVLLEIRQGHLDELIDELNHSKIDVLLTDGPLNYASKKYQSIPLGHDKVVAVAGRKFKSSTGKFPKNLDGRSYVANSNESYLQKEVNFLFERNKISPEVIARVDDITLMRVITEKGNNFAVMPSKSVKEAVRLKNLKVLGALDGLESSLWATIPKVSSNRRLVSQLIKTYFKYN